MGLTSLNFCGVGMLLKSIFSGVNLIRSESPSKSHFLGVDRKVTPNLGDSRLGVSFGGVRTVEWNDEFRFKSISGDHVAGNRFRPGNSKESKL